jgi:hypothetical protein
VDLKYIPDVHTTTQSAHKQRPHLANIQTYNSTFHQLPEGGLGIAKAGKVKTLMAIEGFCHHSLSVIDSDFSLGCIWVM